MLRSSLLAVSAAILCTAASGQSQIQAKKVLGPVRDAGIYHVATGTWTRAGGHANISPDCIYKNDIGTGYFGTGWEGCKGVDEVMLPGTTNPAGGPQDFYLVDGFSFGYCNNGAGDSVDWTFDYYDSFQPCEDVDSPANCLNKLPQTYSFTNLPGNGCWIVTIDLAGGYELCFEADGGVCAPGYDGGGLGLDYAGVQHQWTTTGTGLTGPLLSGDPDWDIPGAETCYSTATGCATPNATGLLTSDNFTITGQATLPNCGVATGCYFFGGYINSNGCGGAQFNPNSSFNMCLFTDCTATCTPGGCDFTTYCDTNPANAADMSIDACTISGNSANVSMTGAVPSQFSYLLVGASNGSITDPPGAEGDLCLIGSKQGRYTKDVQVTDSTGFANTQIYDSTSGGGGWALPTALGDVTVGSTWNFQYWHRDGMNLAKFSDAISVTFN